MGHVINGQCYTILLRLLRNAIKTKRPEKLANGALIDQENALAHKTSVSMAMGVTVGLNWLVTIPRSFFKRNT